MFPNEIERNRSQHTQEPTYSISHKTVSFRMVATQVSSVCYPYHMRVWVRACTRAHTYTHTPLFHSSNLRVKFKSQMIYIIKQSWSKVVLLFTYSSLFGLQFSARLSDKLQISGRKTFPLPGPGGSLFLFLAWESWDNINFLKYLVSVIQIVILRGTKIFRISSSSRHSGYRLAVYQAQGIILCLL